MKRVVIIGAGAHGREVTEILRHRSQLGADVLLVDPGQEQEVAFRAMLGDDEDDEEDLRPRPPVITVRVFCGTTRKRRWRPSSCCTAPRRLSTR